MTKNYEKVSENNFLGHPVLKWRKLNIEYKAQNDMIEPVAFNWIIAWEA